MKYKRKEKYTKQNKGAILILIKDEIHPEHIIFMH